MSYISNYDFVDFVKYDHYADASGDINGYIDVNITTISNLYIGSGFHTMDGGYLYSDSVKFQNKYVIPGSSFKGAVRNIAAATSNSCIDLKCRPYDQDGKVRICIACNMFGFMGQASKVIFPDFKAIKAQAETLDLNKQFSPNCKSENYKYENGKSKGFKFYRTYCKKYDGQKISIKTIAKDSIFAGRIHFSKLTKEQLSLLLFSMGIDESFDIKLGGFKNEGLGHVRVRVENSEFSLNEDAKKLSTEYPMNYGKSQRTRINKLRKILKP